MLAPTSLRPTSGPNKQVWISMRQEAKAAAEREPLLVSFVYSTILNQKTLEAAVAFHLANKVGPVFRTPFYFFRPALLAPVFCTIFEV